MGMPLELAGLASFEERSLWTCETQASLHRGSHSRLHRPARLGLPSPASAAEMSATSQRIPIGHFTSFTRVNQLPLKTSLR